MEMFNSICSSCPCLQYRRIQRKCPINFTQIWNARDQETPKLKQTPQMSITQHNMSTKLPHLKQHQAFMDVHDNVDPKPIYDVIGMKAGT